MSSSRDEFRRTTRLHGYFTEALQRGANATPMSQLGYFPSSKSRRASRRRGLAPPGGAMLGGDEPQDGCPGSSFPSTAHAPERTPPTACDRVGLTSYTAPQERRADRTSRESATSGPDQAGSRYASLHPKLASKHCHCRSSQRGSPRTISAPRDRDPLRRRCRASSGSCRRSAMHRQTAHQPSRSDELVCYMRPCRVLHRI